MSKITEDLKEKAEVYYGDEICKVKSRFFLQEVGLPRGLLPLEDIIECGFVEETGFVWLKQKKKKEHYFEKAGRYVTYAPDITAYVEKLRIKKLTGVKVKEMLIWLTLSDITVDDPPTGKLTCKTPAGLFRTFPTDAFELDAGKK